MRALFLAPLALFAFSASTRADEITSAQAEFFEKKVRPVLVENCYKCHSVASGKSKGGLRLDSRESMLKGSDKGAVLVPGQPAKSRLIEAVGYKDVELQMPPKAKLPDAAIADLTAWVQDGAAWPVDKKVAAGGKSEFNLAKRKQDHWCWQPLRPTLPPAVKDPRWSVHPVDAFIFTKLAAKGLMPAAAADRRTLMRRLSFDITGLPPTPAEVEAFVADPADDAYARLVDRLLASPHFGERWGRHWLDLVRYAETRGHEFDFASPNAYQYRDYVIRALNADVPYNLFVTEHMAGDLIPAPRRNSKEGFNESLLGTGFWFLGEQVHSPVDICQDKADRNDNMLDVMTKTFLGLTVSCARCHDHKFDAISTKDYYALCGFLESSSYRQAAFDTLEHNRDVAKRLADLREVQMPALSTALAEALKPGVGRMAEALLAANGAAGPAAPANLVRWKQVLAEAKKNASDPLHGWGADAALLGNTAAQAREKQARAAAWFMGADVIVDYANVRSDHWLPDGPGFRVSSPASPRYGTSPARPVLRYSESSVAEFDPLWDRLKPAPGTDEEPGAVKTSARSGLGLRTPTFTVAPGRVYALVRGAGRAYAAVESHMMIAGPLHGRLVRDFDTQGRAQWIDYDLSVYRGRRGHLELTPKPGAELTVFKVVQAATAPVVDDGAIAALWIPSASSPEKLAHRYRQRFEEALANLAASQMRPPLDFRLVNWMIEHDDLFLTAEAKGRLEEVAAPLLAEQARLAAELRPESRLAPAMCDLTGVNESVFIRGSYKAPGDLVPRRFLEALAGPQPLAVKHGSGRLELARQMTDPTLDPLLPRVMVNRLWHHLFGRGLVASVDNFGVLGEAPSHPELLDFLADRFVRDGWSLKKMIRLVVLSETYRMSSQPNPAAASVDPQNVLLHRAPVRRLEGEAIRDALLAVSGRLDRHSFGPPIPVHLTEFQEGRGRPASGPLDGNGRRSIYLGVRRNFLSPLLLAFDTPTPFSTVGRRTVSNVPAQALILLNDPFVHQQAEVWAKRVLVEKTPEARVRTMYLDAFCRAPEDREMQACLAYVTAETMRANELAAWTGLAHTLVNAKEFIYLP